MLSHADVNVRFQTFDHLPGTNLGGFAAFRLAVNPHQAIRDHGFALTAAAGNPGQFEQIAQLDVCLLYTSRCV